MKSVSKNPLDEYTSEAYMYHQKFRVIPGKQTGWKRLVGQEVPIEAYSDLLSVNGASNYPAAHSNITDTNGATVTTASVNASVSARQITQVVFGPQTPQATQPALDLWVPLIFWFNRDPRLSIASVSIPYGQRFITVEIAPQNQVLFTAPANLFLRLTTEVLTADSVVGGAGTIAMQNVYKYQRYVTMVPALASNSNIDSTQQISLMELYINNIFVNPEIHDILE